MCSTYLAPLTPLPPLRTLSPLTALLPPSDAADGGARRSLVPAAADRGVRGTWRPEEAAEEAALTWLRGPVGLKLTTAP